MLPLIFILFASVISFYGDNINIQVVRSLSNIKIFEHGKIEVTLKLKNTSSDINFLEIYDTLPNKVKVVKGSNNSVINLKNGEEIDFTYEISCPIRGRYILGPLFFRVLEFLYPIAFPSSDASGHCPAGRLSTYHRLRRLPYG